MPPEPSELILASHNAGKLKEFQAVLGQRWILRPQSDFAISDIDETGATFVENALLKARHASHQGGLPALADDSGLVVPALGGDPGLRSARYSGAGDAANNRLLLDNMAHLEGDGRDAFFIAVLVMLRHAEDPTPVIAEGRWRGRIAHAPKGQEGFGYDPLFVPAGHERHSAELPAEEKNRISHRALAIQQLLKQLTIA